MKTVTKRHTDRYKARNKDYDDFYRKLERLKPGYDLESELMPLKQANSLRSQLMKHKERFGAFKTAILKGFNGEKDNAVLIVWREQPATNGTQESSEGGET